MVEHGLYILKSEFYELVRSLGGDCDDDGVSGRSIAVKSIFYNG